MRPTCWTIFTTSKPGEETLHRLSLPLATVPPPACPCPSPALVCPCPAACCSPLPLPVLPLTQGFRPLLLIPEVIPSVYPSVIHLFKQGV